MLNLPTDDRTRRLPLSRQQRDGGRVALCAASASPAPSAHRPLHDVRRAILPAALAAAFAVPAAAETTVPAAGPSPGLLLPHDLTPWGMFLQADVVVKAVMLGLVAASLATWTVWLAKSVQLAAARIRTRRDAARLADCRSLAEAAERLGFGRGVAARMVRAASHEARVSDGATASLRDRVASHLDRIEVADGRAMMAGTGLLATIGSTAPFVGLFGTVWGIMNAFVGISRAQTTNLAVVAPGIAEALLATAVGLAAAIPAVVIYNGFARSIAGYRSLVGDVSAEIQRIVSRDLDRLRPVRFNAAE